MTIEAETASLGPPLGHVDGCRDGWILGWVHWPDFPDERAIVELVVNGTVVGDALAVLPRGDLSEAGFVAPSYGFALPCEAAFGRDWPGEPCQALVRVRGGEVLPGGVLQLDATSRRAGPAPAPVIDIWPPLIWAIQGEDLSGYVDMFGPTGVGGWIQRADSASPPIEIDLWEGDTLRGTVIADIWRHDVATARGGDGRWGFRSPMPVALFDGRWHRLDVRLRDGRRIVPGAVHVRLPVATVDEAAAGFIPMPPHPGVRPITPLRPARQHVPAETMFSVIINFYNMPREAARTLTSLTRAYQRGIGDLRYEVLCVDNGSDPPLDAAWVESFGPEFRLFRPSSPSASPCGPLNEAAVQARGRYIAVMIDGAHVLTPGILREVWDAVTEAPGSVVALRQWFVAGDQRWLSEAGYGAAFEDMLFDRIAWPKNGYDLFTIGTPIWESPSHWMEDIAESNCLFVPATLYRAIGGLDEKFDEAGAGFANLDFFRRAAEASGEPVIALIGEATFHQFHGGTTTNAVEAVKEARVRQYQNRYLKMRGEPYRASSAFDIRLRGHLPMEAAKMTRQAPLSPANLSITSRVRHTYATQHFDAGACDYANSAYAEAGLHERSFWMGRPLGVAPSDVLSMQDVIFRIRPERIVAVNLAPGLLWFLHGITGLYAGEICKLVVASADMPADLPPSAIVVSGDPAGPAALRSVERALGTAEKTLVLFAPNPGDTRPTDMLRAYAGFVSPRSYLIFVGSVFGQPWLGYSKNWFNVAIRQLVASMPFAIDETVNPHLISTSPLGYLQRIGGLLEVTPGALAEAQADD